MATVLKSQVQKFLEHHFGDFERCRDLETRRMHYNWKFPFYRLWFWPLRFIQHQNWKDIKYRVVINENGETVLSKPNPFLRMIVEYEEGERYNFWWWKHIKFKWSSKKKKVGESDLNSFANSHTSPTPDTCILTIENLDRAIGMIREQELRDNYEFRNRILGDFMATTTSFFNVPINSILNRLGFRVRPDISSADLRIQASITFPRELINIRSLEEFEEYLMNEISRCEAESHHFLNSLRDRLHNEVERERQSLR